jgi:hypothetical protein
VIREPPEVNVSYHFFECTGIYYSPEQGYHCLGKEYAERSTSYVPLTTYSNQCMSAQLENFANVYIIRYLLTGIGLPIATILVKRFQEYIFVNKLLPLVKKGESKERLHRNWWFKVFNKLKLLMPRSLRIIDVDKYVGFNTVVVENPILELPENRTNPAIAAIDNIENINEASTQMLRDTLYDIFLIYFEKKKRIFVAKRFATILVGDLAIFFTFGSIYPPLALVVFVGFLSHCISYQLYLGRFVTIIRKYQQLAHCLKAAQQDSEAVSSLLTMALPAVTTLAALFWSFALFDILSDEVGIGSARWILFVLIGCLLVFRFTGVYVSLKYVRLMFKRVFNYDSAPDNHPEAEMTKLEEVISN